MRKPEQLLWDRMRRNLKGSGIWLERLENVVGTGRPDIDATYDGCVTVVELKQVESFPVRATTPVLGSKGLRLAQENWWLEANKHGRRGIIIVGVGPWVYGFEGWRSEHINKLSQAEFRDSARLVSWQEVIDYLRDYK